MMLRPALVVSAIILSAMHCSSSMANDASTCPPRIAVTQAISGEKPDGWSDYGSNAEHPLVNVSFSLGPPDMKAQLVPSKEERRGRTALATWRFPESETTYWVACEYAETAVVIAKPLDRGITACSAEYDGSFSRPVVRGWNCVRGKAR